MSPVQTLNDELFTKSQTLAIEIDSTEEKSLNKIAIKIRESRGFLS